MSKLQYLKQTLRSIDNQIIDRKIKFKAAFFSHYISKKIGCANLIKFPAAKFRYKDAILQTRPNTIDFWVCLESYEPDLTFFLTSVLKDRKGTFIDVGGHIGRYTTLMAKRDWKVFTFEPIKINYDVILSNLKLNHCDSSATIHNVGLGNTKSTETIYFNPKEMGEASLIKQDTQNAEAQIQIVRFDDYMQNKSYDDLTMVKIDVEGHEESVLNGMMEFLKTEKPLLIIELWKDNASSVTKTLKDLGYKKLHIFWFVEEKHQSYMDRMYKLYNQKTLRYDYE